MADVQQGNINAGAVQRWRCDVCKVKFFDDFNEACAHEAECQAAVALENVSSCGKVDKPPSSNPQSMPQKKNNEENFERHTSRSEKIAVSMLVTQDTIESATTTKTTSRSTSKSKQTLLHPKPKSPIITPTKPSPIKPSMNEDTTIALVQAIRESLSKYTSCIHSLSDQDMASSMDMLARLSSLEVTVKVLEATGIGKTVQKFKKHAILGPDARTLVNDWKRIAGVPPKKAPRSKAKPTVSQHAFFNPRSVPAKAKTSGATTTKKPATVSTPVNPFFAPRKKNVLSQAEMVLEESKNLKRKLPCKKEDISPCTSKAVASIFQNKSSKQILAEQRQVELAARREKERKKEQERQAKREALFASKRCANGTTMDCVVPKKALPPMAPRFPVPNHVVGNALDSSLNPNLVLPDDHPFRSNKMEEESAEQPSVEPNSWLSSPSALDTSNVVTTNFTKIQTALFDTFCVSTSDVTPMASLWSDAYGMEQDSFVGRQSRETFSQLVDWVDHWRIARQEAKDRMAEKHRKLALGKKPKKKAPTKRKYEYYEDDDWLVGDDSSEDDTTAPLCLLTGPPGSGKTSMVHSVAKHCGNCTVLEIHTGQARSGAALKHAIEEATQSNSSMDMLKSKTATVFSSSSTKKARLTDSDDSEDDESSQPNKSSVTIVLIDEVDILFDDAETGKGDAGFWIALASLARATKCPILLTANQAPPQIYHHFCRHLSLSRPSPNECASKLLGVLSSVGVKFHPDLRARGPQVMKKQLSLVASSCDCDLRKLLHELQVFAATSAAVTNHHNPCSKHLVGDNTRIVDKQQLHAVSAPSRHLPTLHSIEPSRIPMDKHSIVTIQGRNFESLRDENDELAVSIGIHKDCPVHIVDNTILRVLCPPYNLEKEEEACVGFGSRLAKRIGFVSITTKTKNYSLPSRSVACDELVDGTKVYGSNYLSVEYAFDEDLPTNDAHGDALAEFETKDSNETPEITANSSSKHSGDDDTALSKWKNIRKLAQTESKDTSDAAKKSTSQEELDMAEELEKLSRAANNASDASFLEDFGEGLPYLSGACKGFGFDYTEDCLPGTKGGKDALRMHENSRPPRAEKMYELGWNDNCYFHGNSDAYVTQPSMSDQAKLSTFMNTFRGDESSAGQLACTGIGNTSIAVTREDLEMDDEFLSREDLDRFCHQEETKNEFSFSGTGAGSSMEEDLYLSHGVSPAILDLPELLRNTSVMSSVPSSSFFLPMHRDSSIASLEDRRSESLERFLSQGISYILPCMWNDLALCSYGRFGFAWNDRDRSHWILECLPALRTICTVEVALETAELEDNATAAAKRASARRTTRLQAKARRHHYLDKISSRLKRDEADKNSSEVGALLAKDRLSFHKLEKETTE